MQRLAAGIGSLLLIAVLAVVSLSQISNRHSHLINGIPVTHSHPFSPDGNGSPFQKHSHEGSDVNLLYQLNDWGIEQDNCPKITLSLQIIERTDLFHQDETCKLISYLIVLSLKDPPMEIESL
jgi:hypothetical protein